MGYLHETLQECVSGQVDLSRINTVGFYFFISKLWSFDGVLCLFCVIYNLVHFKLPNATLIILFQKALYAIT